jgi:peptide/nickel transport system permease protein
MLEYIARRFAYMVFTIWVITVISFVVIQLPPGDYVSTMISKMYSTGTKEVSQEFEAQMREMYGLNQPVIVQYFKWIGNIITKGQFGYSFIYKEDARTMIWERLPMSFALSFFSILFIWAVAMPIGIYSAVNKYTLPDYVVTFLGFIGLAIPNFLLALILIWINYQYFNQSTMGLFSEPYLDAPWSLAKLQDLMSHVWIPVIIIGLGGTAGLIRTMRANLMDELNKPYVDTARAKGLSEARLLWKYPVRHALNPFISTIGWALPALVSGEAIVSMVLNLPTSGPVLLTALMQQDMYLAAGFILLLSTLTVIGTFISDLALAWLDPRIRLQ